MDSTLTEAELYSIIMTYADVMSGRFEIFVGGAIAMIVTIFITKDTLSIYWRGILMLIFSLFSYAQYSSVSGFNTRILQLIESMRIVTQDQINKLPATTGILENPVTDAVSFNSLTIIITWICCLILMAFPKLLIKGLKN